MRINLDKFVLYAQPGHLIRRLQQIAVAVFYEETAEVDITPVQFAALRTIEKNPLLDQRTLASDIAIDASTAGGVIDRLEKRRLIRRVNSPEDRRVRLIQITEKGKTELTNMLPLILSAQRRILHPLTPAEQKVFMSLLDRIVTENNKLSRAPRKE